MVPQIATMSGLQRKMRFKKLGPKTLLPVLREDEVDASEYEALTHENQIATGVEAAEENVRISVLFTTTNITANPNPRASPWTCHVILFDIGD